MSKSRAERGKTPAQLHTPSVPLSNDVVPGRFTESDWNHMLDEETEEDFISDILQETVTSALDQIYYKIIEKQIIPYSVNAARELLLDVIEWQFLVKDPGETGVDEDKTWLEDEEPEPPITDSWAQGIVPVMWSRNLSDGENSDKEIGLDGSNVTPEEEALEEESSRAPPRSAESSVDQIGTKDSSKPDNESLASDSTIINESSQLPKPPSKPKAKGNKGFKPYRGKISSMRPITMTPITDDKPKWKYQQQAVNESGTTMASSELNTKMYYGKASAPRDTMFDQKGNVIGIPKLNMEKLPSHRVKIKFAVVDPLAEEFNAKLANKKQRYNIFRNGDADKRTKADCVVIDDTCPRENEIKLVSPLPPPLVDTIDVAPGVVIKEKGVVKRGIRQPPNQYQSLEPLESSFKTLDGDLRKEMTSTVHPLYKNKPLPAIATQE